MRLNFINNFRAIYYNTLTNFYLYFNTFVPYYDDVILSLSITSFKNIINNNQISLKSIKENRLMKLIYFQKKNKNPLLLFTKIKIRYCYFMELKSCSVISRK